jgi:hypothetical protein
VPWLCEYGHPVKGATLTACSHALRITKQTVGGSSPPEIHLGPSGWVGQVLATPARARRSQEIMAATAL